MPKMKTKRGAAKRFEFTGTGKIKRRRAFANHILEKKSSKRKRHLQTPGTVDQRDDQRVRRMLGR